MIKPSNHIELINFIDEEDTYKLIHKWCSNNNVYEWFEQRVLSYDEIKNKYKNKYVDGKQHLFMIKDGNKLIGLVQIYQYDDLMIDELKKYPNIYEFDLFIGERDYLDKGIGTKVVGIVNQFIYDNYQADCIVLRPFKRNVRAIKCYEKSGFRIVAEYDGKDTLGNFERIVVLINTKK